MKTIRAGLLCLVCAVMLALAYGAARDRISDNERRHRELVLRDMLAGLGDVTLAPSGDSYLVFQGGAPVATIARIRAPEGYNGDIHLWLATGHGPVEHGPVEHSPAEQAATVLAVRAISHKETPGIGDKIDHKVSPWLDQFAGRSMENATWRLRRSGGDFDGIAGATVTSRAVVNAIATSLAGEPQ